MLVAVDCTYTNTYFGVLKQNIYFKQCIKIQIVSTAEVSFLHQMIKKTSVFSIQNN